MSILNDEIEALDSIEFIIKEWVDKYCMINGTYYIKNNEIYVDGSVGIYLPSITRLPYKFKKVTGTFNCDMCSLYTLHNCPDEVGNFSCIHCLHLTSLEGAPRKVHGALHVEGNQFLRSLSGAPELVEGVVICYNTGISQDDWNIYKYFHCPYYKEFHPTSKPENVYAIIAVDFEKEMFDRRNDLIEQRGENYFCCDHI